MFAHVDIDVCKHREVYGFSLVLCVKSYVCACRKMHVCANPCMFARAERVRAPRHPNQHKHLCVGAWQMCMCSHAREYAA